MKPSLQTTVSTKDREQEEEGLKPSFSLDLSISPSSNGEDYTIAFADGANPSFPSQETASQLVQKLLEQVTMNDSPPTNEMTSDNVAYFNMPAFQKDEWARQCVTQPLSQIETTSLKSSSPKSFASSTLYDPTINIPRNVSQQGHMALINLCIRTLESIGQPIQSIVDEKNLEKNQILGMSTKQNLASTSNSSSLSWIRHKWKRNSPPALTDFSDRVGNTSLTGTDNSEPKADEIFEKGRLKQFGSEYARFLSATPLAPKELSVQGSSKRQYRPTSFRRRNVLKTNALNIEDADQPVITGPITDIIVTQNDETPPKGYYRLSQSSSGEPFLLRVRKTTLYICVKKETNWDRAAQRPCVTALTIIFPERKEFVPPGFSLVRRLGTQNSSIDRPPANVNIAGNEPAYLCFRRSREGNPITGILPLFPSRREAIPEGYTVVEKTPRNFIAHLGSSNDPVFLAFRQRLANLELLRPLPLVMSVYNNSYGSKQLLGYYSTGGTVVRSRVGRFHIMDRSTHSLLSPSSINNRLSLIESSRRKSLDQMKEGKVIPGDKYIYSGSESDQSNASSKSVLNSSALPSYGLRTSASQPARSDSDQQSSLADFESIASSSDLNRSLNQSYHNQAEEDTENINASRQEKLTQFNSDFHGNKNKDIERCLEAMNFIPAIFTGLNENDTKAIMVFQTRAAILTPVLTSCYTRHGGAALIAVEGLISLLQQDFFADDVHMTRNSSAQTTLLDIAVQVVCDVATMGSQETHLYPCVEFVGQSVKYGCGYLSTRSIGYVLRFYLFVFYFGVSSPAGNWGVLRSSDQYVLEDPRAANTSVLPGGAPQLAILSLKDLIMFLVARLGSFAYLDQCVAKRKNERLRLHNSGPLQIFSMIDEIIDEAIDTSVHRVELANLTELATHQIMRSGGSELFWYEMIHSCGNGLFGNNEVLREETRHLYALCFALLANCVKIASTRVRKNKNSQGIPRDTASKMMSLEMLKFFLDTWEKGVAAQEVSGSNAVSTFVYCVRRLVVPSLLRNTPESLEDPRVFRRVIQVIGGLWCSSFYRSHMKLEIGVLFDHFVLRLLNLGPQILFKSSDDNEMTYLFAQQLELLKEVKNWFSKDVEGLIELFLNFDTECGAYQDDAKEELLCDLEWRICERLCSSLCSLSEKCTEFLSDKIRESQSTSPVDNFLKVSSDNQGGYEGVSTVTLARESGRRLRQGALDALSQIVRALAETAASAHGSKVRYVFCAWAEGEAIDRRRIGMVDVSKIYKEEATNMADARDEEETTARPGSTSVLGYWQRLSAIKMRIAETKIQKNTDTTINFDSSVYSGYEENSKERRNNLKVAFKVSAEKSLSKAMDYLIACNVLTASPRDIASFLRIHRDDLSPVALGKYLGEGGTNRSETEYWNNIRFNYIRAISFVGMTVEGGLRHLLTQGGFRLPGEAQQIDRIISTFAQCYWEDNAGDMTHCPFQDQDTIFLLSFAIIMLNTDLHKNHAGAKTGAKKNQRKNMSKVEFINNLRGVGKGNKIDTEYLSKIYDEIETHPIRLHEDDNFDDASSTASEDVQTSIVNMIDNAKKADALLRGLSIHEYRYIPLREYKAKFVFDKTNNAVLELVHKFLEKTWHQFHGLINSFLEKAHLDPKGMESCVHLIKYIISLTILLDMSVEQIAFLDQLGRFRLFDALRHTNDGDAMPICCDQDSYKKEDWYIKLESQAQISKQLKSNINHESSGRVATPTDFENGKLQSLLVLDEIVNKLGFTVAFDAAERKALRDAVRQLENAEFLLNDPSRSFSRQGNLLKRSNRSGRCIEYRFFLFSDILIYAKKIPGSCKYRIHEELPLILMKVVDWFPPTMKKESKLGIQIYHPRKKFLILCSTNEERKSWVKDLRDGIDQELKHKVAMEGARKAAALNVMPTNYG